MNYEFVTYKDMQEFDSACLFFIEELDRKFFPHPWTHEMWLGSLNNEYFINTIVIESKVIGFALFSINIVDSFSHLFKIVIDPAFRSNQFGTKLLQDSVAKLKEMGVSNYFLEVEEFNLSAQAVYKKCGFNGVHLKKKFYSDGTNALIMTMSL